MSKEKAEDVWQLPEWKVSGVFASHMVLQRDRPITIWGWSRHIGAEVTALWGQEPATAKVAEDGRFELKFAPRPASFVPSCIEIFSSYGRTVFSDVLVGDVWVIGGQSNAELSMDFCMGDAPEIENTVSDEHSFRLFTQTHLGAIECTGFHHIPARDVIKPEWTWKLPEMEAAREFSALGYYFSRIMAEQVSVPLGVIMMCAGGACLRELMPYELAYERGYRTGGNLPIGGFFNTLIAPFVGLQFIGQIFFQGESEGIYREMALSYHDDLAAFVADERQRFGFNFSFYNIQLSSYREECDEYFPHLYWVRSRQFQALKMIPNSYLIVSRDLGSRPGEPDFAHSKHKYELAGRVAALVMAGDYGIGKKDEVCSPIPVRAVKNGNNVTVTFSCVNGELMTLKQKFSDTVNTSVAGFSFWGKDGITIPAFAEIISSSTVRILIPEDADGTKVCFAMSNMAYLEQADLCGGTGLPVPAFELDVIGV